MTGVVLDTHALVWLLGGDRRLGPRSRELIARAAEQGDVSFSAISAWEIAMLVAKGRLELDRDVLDWLEAAARLPGLGVTPLSTAIAVGSTRLPGELHGDPADRLIVATARHLGAALVTADRALLGYAASGHLEAQAAGD